MQRNRLRLCECVYVLYEVQLTKNTSVAVHEPNVHLSAKRCNFRLVFKQAALCDTSMVIGLGRKIVEGNVFFTTIFHHTYPMKFRELIEFEA